MENVINSHQYYKIKRRLKNMKIKEFVNRYNALETIEAKNNFIQNNLTVKEYLPFINKITLAENLIDKSVYEHENYIDNDGNTQSRKTGNIKLDSVVQYLLFNRIIIEYYTNLEIETKGFYEEYDMLCQNGIMEQIASLIPKEEINELKTIIDFNKCSRSTRNIIISRLSPKNLPRFFLPRLWYSR